MAFKVKLLLLAGAGRALDLVGRVGDGCCCITSGDALGRHDEAARFHGLFHRQDGLEFVHQHLGFVSGFAGIQHVARHDHGHGLANELDLASGEDRLVVHDGAAVVFAGNVFGGVNRHHAVLTQDGCAVNAVADQFAMRHGRQDERGIQSACVLRNVVNVGGRACDVQMRGLVHQLFALLDT